jgi:hypothetical protein
MKLFKRMLYSLRFALGATLFGIFYSFSSGKGECGTPSGSITAAYIGFLIVTVVLFLELGYAIVRTRALETEGNESKIIARAAFFLFDSTYLLLGTITAFAALYLLCPVIDVACTTGRDALYFSMVTFTTLGYGDLTPNDQFKIVAAGQAVLGYITLGLIVGYAGSLFSVKSKVKN